MAEVTTPPTNTNTDAAAPSPGRADRRAAVLATIIKDAPQDSKDASEEAPADAKADVKAKVDEAKADDKPVSPQLAALAKRDKELRAKEQAFKDAQEKFKTEQAAKEAEHGNVEQFAALFRTDIGALADKQKLTPQQRMDLAEDLWLSAQPEDKIPEKYKDRWMARKGQAKQMTEAEQLKAQMEKQAKEFEDYKKSVAEEKQKAEQDQVKNAFLETAKSEISYDNYPHVAALLESDPKTTMSVLWDIVVEKFNADPDSDEDITTAMVAGAYEEFLASKFKTLEKVYGKKDKESNDSKEAKEDVKESTKVSTSISSKKATSASPVRTEPTTREERRALALKKIGVTG